jgi:divalent metal cation (Fe/Co/Zn/Cd) transporter
MEYVKKLPLILSMFMAILIGLISYTLGIAQKDIYIRISISLVLFYFLGLYIRRSIENLYDSYLQKKSAVGNELENELESEIESEKVMKIIEKR